MQDEQGEVGLGLAEPMSGPGAAPAWHHGRALRGGQLWALTEHVALPCRDCSRLFYILRVFFGNPHPELQLKS